MSTPVDCPVCSAPNPNFLDTPFNEVRAGKTLKCSSPTCVHEIYVCEPSAGAWAAWGVAGEEMATISWNLYAEKVNP